LTAIDGVLGAEPAAGEGFSVRVSNLRSTAAALVATAVHHDWGLYEVAQQQSKLEQVFVELTCNDDVRPSAGGGDD
jgi:hypothetical protein